MIPTPPRALGMVLLLLLVGLVVSGCSAPAEAGRYSVTLIIEQHHVLKDGQTLVGDTVVAGGTMFLDEGAEHLGSMTVLAGDTRISGRIVGDLTILGGTATLTDTAMITGDLVAAVGAVTRTQGTVVQGSVRNALTASSEPSALGERAAWSLLAVAVMAGLAWLATRLAPRPMHRTAAAATGFPLVSGALGALILIAALPLMASMIFTLFLIPVAGIVLLGVGATAVYGLLATGCELGGHIGRRLGMAWTPSRAASLGTAILMAGLLLIRFVPFVGAGVTAIIFLISVGATFLTAFGLRTYLPPSEFPDDSSAANTNN